METFSLSIITPSNHTTLTVEWVEVQSPTGSFFVGPQHSPLVSLLKKNSSLLYKVTGEQPSSVAVTGGVLSIKNNAVLALID